MKKEYFYILVPKEEKAVGYLVQFMPVQDLVSDSEDNVRRCQQIYDLLHDNFHTRRKFLELWPHVRYVAFIEKQFEVISFAAISTPMNWQVDYVVTKLDLRGQGMAVAICNKITNEAIERKIPYIMLSSIPELIHIYAHQNGYTVIGDTNGNVAELPINLQTK